MCKAKKVTNPLDLITQIAAWEYHRPNNSESLTIKIDAFSDDDCIEMKIDDGIQFLLNDEEAIALITMIGYALEAREAKKAL